MTKIDFKKYFSVLTKKENKAYFITLVLLLVVLIFSILTYGFSTMPFNNKPVENIKNFYEKQLGEYGGSIEILSSKFDKKVGVYNIKAEIEFFGQKQEAEFLVSKDGSLFFPEPIEIIEKEIPKKETVDVKLFTMSYCPYGNQAEEGLIPVIDLLKDTNFNITPHYIIYQNYGDIELNCIEEGKYCSMHGIGELNQDIREMCIFKYEPENYWKYIAQVNTHCDYENIESCWEGVAKEVGIDTNQVKTCQKEEAIDLLDAEIAMSTEYGVEGSPTVFINDVLYEGSRSPEDYKKAICEGFKEDSRPEECDEVLSTETGAEGSC